MRAQRNDCLACKRNANACRPMWCVADDLFALAALRLRPYYTYGVTNNVRSIRGLLHRAQQDPKFVLRIVAFSTSIAAGGRRCPESLHSRDSCCKIMPPDHQIVGPRLNDSIAKDLKKRALAFGNGSFRWHSSYRSGWFDCGCGWPARLARLLSTVLPHGNFLVVNQNRHATGPIHPLQLLESSQFLREYGHTAHAFILDYAAHEATVLHGRPAAKRLKQMESELLVRKLLTLPQHPMLVTLQLPYTGKGWDALLRNVSAAADAAFAVQLMVGAPLSQHYGTAQVSLPAALVAAAQRDTRLADVPCLARAYGRDMTHPDQCIHDMAAELLLAQLHTADEARVVPHRKGTRHDGVFPDPLYLRCEDTLATHRGLMKRASRRTSPGAASVQDDEASVCVRMWPAATSLMFSSVASVHVYPPLTHTSCVDWPPSRAQASTPTSMQRDARMGAARGVQRASDQSRLGGGQRRPGEQRRSLVAEGVCIAHDGAGRWSRTPAIRATTPMTSATPLVHTIDQFQAELECVGMQNTSCLPTRSRFWAATFDDARRQFGWFTCGLPKAAPLKFGMSCPSHGIMYVSWLRSYSEQWGIVDVSVTVATATSESAEVLAHATIDSRDETRLHTFVETTALPLEGSLKRAGHGPGDASSNAVGAGGKLSSRFSLQNVIATFTPRTRGSTAARGRYPAVRELDKQCPNKFKLVALACY